MKDKNADMNYESVAAEVVEKSGGAENIKTVAHCATRLRFTLADKSAADMDAIKKMQKKSEITEDDQKNGEKKVQTLTDRYTEGTS